MIFSTNERRAVAAAIRAQGHALLAAASDLEAVPVVGAPIHVGTETARVLAETGGILGRYAHTLSSIIRAAQERAKQADEPDQGDDKQDQPALRVVDDGNEQADQEGGDR